jgi:hypothetical protein
VIPQKVINWCYFEKGSPNKKYNHLTGEMKEFFRCRCIFSLYLSLQPSVMRFVNNKLIVKFLSLTGVSIFFYSRKLISLSHVPDYNYEFGCRLNILQK